MKRWSDDSDIYLMFPVDGENLCAACFLERHSLDKEAMDSMKEVNPNDVCDCCGEKFSSERAEEGNDEVVVLSFM